MKSVHLIVSILVLAGANLALGQPSASLIASLTAGLGLIKLMSDSNRRAQELRRKLAETKLPMIPNRLPLVGNAYHVFLENNFCHLLKEYHAKMGESVGILYGPDLWVLTMDTDLLHQVYVTDGSKNVNFTNLRLPNVTYMHESLLQAKDDKWRRSRRQLNPWFTSNRVKSPMVVRDCLESCERFLAYLAGRPVDGQGGRTIDVLVDFPMLTMDTILRVVAGRDDVIDHRLGGKANETIQVIHTGLKSLFNPFLVAGIFLDWMRSPAAFIDGFTAHGRMHKYLAKIYAQSARIRSQRHLLRTTEGAGDDSARLIDSMMQWPNDAKTRDLNGGAHFHFTFMAGYETTSNALAIMFWLLARHPEVQERLREAIVLEGEEAPYLLWCIHETIRLFPSVPASGRVLAADLTTSGGLRIPRGTAVSASIYSIHHSAEYWGPDVEQFRPERFAEPLKHQHQFFGFGAGPRGCLGRHLAELEMKAIVSRILARYRVEPVASTPRELGWRSPHLIHIVVEGPINLKFVELKRAHESQ